MALNVQVSVACLETSADSKADLNLRDQKWQEIKRGTRLEDKLSFKPGYEFEW